MTSRKIIICVISAIVSAIALFYAFETSHSGWIFSLSKGKTNNSVVLVPFAKYIPYEELIKRSDFIMAHLPSPIAHDNSDDCFDLNYTTFDWDKFIDNWNDEYFDEWKEIHAKDSYGKGDDTNWDWDWEDAKEW